MIALVTSVWHSDAMTWIVLIFRTTGVFKLDPLEVQSYHLNLEGGEMDQ